MASIGRKAVVGGLNAPIGKSALRASLAAYAALFDRWVCLTPSRALKASSKFANEKGAEPDQPIDLPNPLRQGRKTRAIGTPL